MPIRVRRVSGQVEPEPLLAGFSTHLLFGRYCYKKMVPRFESEEFGQLGVIHGPNGSGKTTLLRLLYNVFALPTSPRSIKAIATTPFSSFKAVLTDGSEIQVKRKRDELLGDFTLSYTNAKGKTVEAKIPWSETEAPMYMRKAWRRVSEFAEESKLRFNVTFLTDERELIEPTPEDDEPPTRHLRRRRDRPRNREVALGEAIERFERWAQVQASAAWDLGNQNAHELYEVVASSLAEPPEEGMPEVSLAKMREELRNLEAASVDYSRVGLTPLFRSQGLIRALESASTDRRRLAWRVLSPYLEGVRSKLVVQQELMSILTKFIDTLGEFYSHKRCSFHPVSGLVVHLDEGRGGLSPSHLSSGEIQLLVMFCNLLCSRDVRSIVLIDEPELSLNPAWQRILIPTMLRFIAGSPTQLLLSTHSVELLARYRERAISLYETEPNAE